MKRFHKSAMACHLALAAGVMSLAVGVARLGAAAYMKIPDIPGESQRAGYEGWIELEAVHTDLERVVASGRVSGSAVFGPFRASKVMDASSPYLALATMKGTALGEVQIDLIKPLDAGLDGSFAEFRLKEARLSEFAQATSGEPVPTDSFALNFSEIEWHYRRIDSSTGRVEEEIGTYFNLVAATGGTIEAVDTRPSIIPVQTVEMNPDDTSSVAVMITDPDTPLSSLVATATSLDPELVEVTGFSNEGDYWLLTLHANPRRRGGTSIALSVSDGKDGASRHVPVVVGGVETSYEAYLMAAFGKTLDTHPEWALPLEDPDKDNLTTILEYYLGTHPGIPTANRDAFEVIPGETAKGRQLTVHFYRRNDEPDLTGTVQASANFLNWVTLGPNTTPPLSVTISPVKDSAYEEVTAVIFLGSDPPDGVLLRYQLTGEF